MKRTALFLLIGMLASARAAVLPLRDSLGMFESGATTPRQSAADHLRGASGEVSRFQIMPEVWRAYSDSRDYANPEVAWPVAKRILDDRIDRFRAVTHRAPIPLEIYLLWSKP